MLGVNPSASLRTELVPRCTFVDDVCLALPQFACKFNGYVAGTLPAHSSGITLQPKEGWMSQQRKMVEGTRKPTKRLLATGRKINGTWEVRTFLRLDVANAAAGNETFWERWRWNSGQHAS